MSSDDANEVIAGLLDGIDIDDVDATKWPQRQAVTLVFYRFSCHKVYGGCWRTFSVKN